jgi:hypothetical protein
MHPAFFIFHSTENNALDVAVNTYRASTTDLDIQSIPQDLSWRAEYHGSLERRWSIRTFRYGYLVTT